MSHALENIIEALKIIDSMGTYPAQKVNTPYLLLDNIAGFDKFRETAFADEQSREVFDWVYKYRIVSAAFGNDCYPIPGAPITPEYWKELTERAKSMTEGFAEGDYIIDRIDTWLLESYRLEGRCEVEPGDVVLDCGAHVGNTALYFAQKTGDTGHVYAFEPMPDAFTLLEKNTGQLSNVSPVNSAVLDKQGIVKFSEMGAGSAPVEGWHSAPVVPAYATSIDAFVRDQHIEKVDFIKMDIEGGEAAALEGARETITRWKPKMAISVYHKALDICELPLLIKSILPEYSFSMRHHTHIGWETVLYCYCA